jgi:hypothetical protein
MAPSLITHKKNQVAFLIFLGQAAILKLTYRTPIRTMSQLKKIQLFRTEEKPLAGTIQSHQKNDTSPISWPF